MAVGATDDEDQKASFSNYGDWVHVSAPGDGPPLGESSVRGIFSTFPNGKYSQKRGTSMATPHVAGAAALLLSHFPDMGPLEVKTRIMRSVDVREALEGVNVASGRINVHKALTEEFDTPFIFSVRPGAAHEGDLVCILGDRFGEAQRQGSVIFHPDLKAEIVSWSDSAIECRVPESAETGLVKIQTPEETSNDVPITILVSYYEEDLIEHRFLEEGTPMGWQADDFSWEYVLPFAFPFFKKTFDRVYVCSNGFLVFEDPAFYSYDNGAEAFEKKVMIAPLWDDLLTIGSTGADIYIHSPSPESVSFRWAGRRYRRGSPVNVEAILYEDGRIEFNYGSDNANLSPTIGISGGDGAMYHFSAYDGSSELEKVDTVRFVPLSVAAAETSDNGGGGNGDGPCFIATAAFGSPWQRHVCTLRTFRDQYLKSFSLGRLFIRLYERYSPPLAQTIEKHEEIRPLFRAVLLPLVAFAYVMVHFGPGLTLFVAGAGLLLVWKRSHVRGRSSGVP
jgi:hypothetical protein